MAARFSPPDVMETEVKRRLGPLVQRRGDGFAEAESIGMLHLVRAHWREGWDVIAQLHNQQCSKHNRSADSLKKKFSRLYRANVPMRGAKNHQAITFAHVVHKEMVEGVSSATPSVDDEQTEQSEKSFQAPQGEEREQDGGATESEHSWVETPSEVLSSTAATGVVTAPVAGSVATTSSAAAARPRPRGRPPRPTPEWHNPAAIFPPEATPLPSDDLLTSVLKVILRSQYQRDLDREEERIRREEERIRREEERQRRRKEDEQRRQEEEHRRNEEREEWRRRNEERAEERDENRRRHEQFMQMMMLLVGKKDTAEERDTKS